MSWSHWKTNYFSSFISFTHFRWEWWFNDSENNCQSLSIFKIMNIYHQYLIQNIEETIRSSTKSFRLLMEIKYLIQRLLTHGYECRKSTLMCYIFYQYGEVNVIVLLVNCNPSSNLFSHVIIISTTTKSIAHGMSLWYWLITRLINHHKTQDQTFNLVPSSFVFDH